MKKLIVTMLIVLLLLSGCSVSVTEPPVSEQPVNTAEPAAEPSVSEEAEEEPVFTGNKIQPLPDNTMDNLNDAILSISLEEGGAYVDDTGIMRMDLKIYSYDLYDMVDIAMLKEGDAIVTHSGEIVIGTLRRGEDGTVHINGGFDNGGIDLVTDEGGVFYQRCYNDSNDWYEVGEATIRVSADFRGTDSIDPEKGEVQLYPGDFLVGAVTDYNFSPYNTVIRVEAGQIVSMTRIYTP